MSSSILATLVLLVASPGCRAGGANVSSSSDAEVLPANPSAQAPSPPSRGPSPSAPPSVPPPPPGVPGSASAVPARTDGGVACREARDCASGETCLFTEAGCDAQGTCRRVGAVPSHSCYVAIAMCSCSSHRTFYGQGGCAGSASEPWKLYACACNTDADCRGGQRCEPAKPNRPHGSNERECRDAVPGAKTGASAN